MLSFHAGRGVDHQGTVVGSDIEHHEALATVLVVSLDHANPHGEGVSVSRNVPFVQNGRFRAEMRGDGTTFVLVNKPSAGLCSWGTPTAKVPAALAAAMPGGLSSSTRTDDGGRPNRAAAVR